MSIKRVLLPINGLDDVKPVADLAFMLAERVGAEVEVLHPQTPFYDVITSVGESGSSMQIMKDIDSVKARFEQDIADAARCFSELSKAHGAVKSTYVEVAGPTSEIVAQRAFSSDLVAIGNAATFDSMFWRAVYDGALLHSTRPVLVAPSGDGAYDTSAKFASEVLIAWNGTAESARAFTAAQPFFSVADQVQLLTVGDDKRVAETAHQMKEFAELHGATANVKLVRTDLASAAGTILDEASQRPGTLLVMGAYSHARWREKIFGGVTEHILHHAKVPVLMAH